MKTAISMESTLLLQADKTARQLGLSRSGLFARAVNEFLERQRQATMLEALNEVYAPDPTPNTAELPGIKQHFRKTIRDRW
jgi:metal-responsive CopG/Arc/MetJ family transcriptional regulator